MYSVKELFSTLQGEGTHSGRVSIFCRFSGCNLWSGREEDRSSAICQFCDTDFVGTSGIGGGKFDTPESLAKAIETRWLEMTPSSRYRYVVFTGGEPLLQLDTPLIEALHRLHFEIAIETNGTIKPPAGIDWICVSPKNGSELVCMVGNEMKYVVPQKPNETNRQAIIESLKRFEKMSFQHFYLQAMDGPNREEHLALTMELCKERPQWRLSTQTHKYLQIP